MSKIKWTQVGDTTPQSTKISVGLNITDEVSSDYNVLAVQMETRQGGAFVRGWLNGVEITKVGLPRVLENTDFTNMRFRIGEGFTGSISEVVVMQTDYMALSYAKMAEYNNWLADKWSNRTQFNGHIPTTAGSEPTLPTGIQEFITKYLHYDETTLNLNGNEIISWNDKANFGGSNKNASYKVPISDPSEYFQLTQVKGRNTFEFDGSNYLEADLNNTSAPILTFFIVFKPTSIFQTSDLIAFRDVNGGNPTKPLTVSIDNGALVFTQFVGVQERTGTISAQHYNGGFTYNPSSMLLGSFTVNATPDAGTIVTFGINWAIGTIIEPVSWMDPNAVVVAREPSVAYLNIALPNMTAGDTFLAYEPWWEAVPVSSNGSSTETVTIEYSVDSSYNQSATATVTSGQVSEVFKIENLTPNTTYNYRIRVGNVVEISNKQFKTFKSGAHSFKFVIASDNTTGNTTTLDFIAQRDFDFFIMLGGMVDNVTAQDFTDNLPVIANDFQGIWDKASFYSTYNERDFGAPNKLFPSLNPNKVQAVEMFDKYLANPSVENTTTLGHSFSFSVGRSAFIVVDTNYFRNNEDSDVAPSTPKTIIPTTLHTWVYNKSVEFANNPNIEQTFILSATEWSGLVDKETDYSFGETLTGRWDDFERDRAALNFNASINRNITFIGSNQTNQGVDSGKFNSYTPIYLSTTLPVLPNNLPPIIGYTPFDELPFWQITPNITVGALQRGIAPVAGSNFSINSNNFSGGVFPIAEQGWTEITVIDNGDNWITNTVSQFQVRNGNVVKIREYSFNRRCVSGNVIPEPQLDNEQLATYSGQFEVPIGRFNQENAPLALLSPTNLSDIWKGEVTLRSLVDSLNKRVDFYRAIGGEEYLIDSKLMSGLTVTFTVSKQAGYHIYRLVDNNTNTQIGVDFIPFLFGNNGLYDNLQVELYETTDIDYYVSGQQARVDGQFSFTRNPLTSGIVKAKLVSVGDDLYSRTIQTVNSVDTITTTTPHGMTFNDKFNCDGVIHTVVDVNGANQISFTPRLLNESPTTITRVEVIVWSETAVRAELPRSYVIPRDNPVFNSPFPRRAYLYDTALAIIASSGMGREELATRMVRGSLKTVFPNGVTPFSVIHTLPESVFNDPYIRNGATAWMAYSWAYYLEYFPNSTIYSQVADALEFMLNYLTSMRNTVDGVSFPLVRGGSGRYLPDGTFDANFQIPWFSTEHNIDSYFAFSRAGRVLNNPLYTSIANEIKDGMFNLLWDNDNQRFFQGYQDTADALDCNSWGAMFCLAVGEEEKAHSLLSRCESIYRVTDEVIGAGGYKPYSSNWGYPNARDLVWFEGSFGVAMAYRKAGNSQKYRDIMAELKRFEEDDGTYRYAAIRDDLYEISDYVSMASTVWYILTQYLTDTMWNS